MKVDIFQTIDPLAEGPGGFHGYGLVESIDYIPILHSYYYVADGDKTFKIIQILQSKDRTIAIGVEQNFSVSHIFSIPGAFDGPDVCYPSCPVIS